MSRLLEFTVGSGLMALMLVVPATLIWVGAVIRCRKRFAGGRISDLKPEPHQRVVGRVVELHGGISHVADHRRPAVWIRRKGMMEASHCFLLEDTTGARIRVNPARANYAERLRPVSEARHFINNLLGRNRFAWREDEIISLDEILEVAGQLGPIAEPELDSKGYRVAGPGERDAPLGFDSNQHAVHILNVSAMRRRSRFVPDYGDNELNSMVILLTMALIVFLMGIFTGIVQ